MSKINYIQQELQDIAPFLANLPKVNCFVMPYDTAFIANLQLNNIANKKNNILALQSKLSPFAIPPHYFENNLINILEACKYDTFEDSYLNKIGKLNVFAVPENYFENNASAILKACKIAKNTNDTFLDIYKINVFNTPENYFESNYKIMLEACKNTASTPFEFDQLSKINIFEVPNSYFEHNIENTLGLENNIESGITTKTAIKPEFDFEIKKSNNFKTPENYFENLQSNIFNKIQENNSNTGIAKPITEVKGTIVQFSNIKKHWFKIASIAASVIILASFALLLLKPDTLQLAQKNTEKNIYKKYLEENIDDFEVTLDKKKDEKISRNQMQNYLEKELDENTIDELL